MNREQRRARFRGVAGKHHGSKKPTKGRESTLHVLIAQARSQAAGK